MMSHLLPSSLCTDGVCRFRHLRDVQRSTFSLEGQSPAKRKIRHLCRKVSWSRTPSLATMTLISPPITHTEARPSSEIPNSAISKIGCPRSNYTARRCLSILKPKLNDVEEECWEDLDSMDIANGAQSLRWLVWPKIDDDSRESLAAECPRIIVNPKPSPLGFRGVEVPNEALPGIALDDPIVKDIDPKTWEVCRVAAPRAILPSTYSPNELPMAERFRLAFVEREARLAPKRAKNARQHKRRADREWVMRSADAKSIALASQLSKSLHGRS